MSRRTPKSWPTPAGLDPGAWTGAPMLIAGRLLSPLGWQLVRVIAITVLLLAALWRWPVFDSAGWAGTLYRLHDDVWLPLKGRWWDRNQPWASVAALTACGTMAAAIAARARIARLYERGVNVALASPVGRRNLRHWTRGLGYFGDFGTAGFSHTLSVADLASDQVVAQKLSAATPSTHQQPLSADEREALLAPLELRMGLARSSRIAAYDLLAMALKYRLETVVATDREITKTIEHAIAPLRDSEESLIRNTITVIDYFAAPRLAEVDVPKNAVAVTASPGPDPHYAALANVIQMLLSRLEA